MDTPERGEQCFIEASAALADLIPVGTTLYMVPDTRQTDQYQRLLRYLYVLQEDGSLLHVNAAMGEIGQAAAMTISPDTRYADLFEGLQIEAQPPACILNSTP